VQQIRALPSIIFLIVHISPPYFIKVTTFFIFTNFATFGKLGNSNKARTLKALNFEMEQICFYGNCARALVKSSQRLRQRIEAAIANNQYNRPGIVRTFQDKGIRYLPRCSDEPPMRLKMKLSEQSAREIIGQLEIITDWQSSGITFQFFRATICLATR
jgi:hypothetical protein